MPLSALNGVGIFWNCVHSCLGVVATALLIQDHLLGWRHPLVKRWG
jgi:hypothetical protein